MLRSIVFFVRSRRVMRSQTKVNTIGFSIEFGGPFLYMLCINGREDQIVTLESPGFLELRDFAICSREGTF